MDAHSYLTKYLYSQIIDIDLQSILDFTGSHVTSLAVKSWISWKFCQVRPPDDTISITAVQSGRTNAGGAFQHHYESV